MVDLTQIQKAIEDSEADLESKRRWNPKHCGEIDIRIASDGTWYHEGAAIKRQPLVKLFASVLRREDDGDYYLVTPVEKMRIQVDDAPFLAHSVDILQEQNHQALLFTTNLEQQVIADPNHPIRVEHHPDSGEPRPYIRFRDHLDALISRNAFLELAAHCTQLCHENGDTEFIISSRGCEFSLGRFNNQ